MEAWTSQAIFDKVANHLLKQGKKAVNTKGQNPEGYCVYRTPDGLKCAAGCLIADEHYSEHLENYDIFHGPVDDALERSIGVNSSTDGGAFSLIRELQVIHDNQEPKEWPGALVLLALHKHLDLPECLQEKP